MERTGYIDLHCDTITMMHYPKENLTANRKMVSIPSMQEGNTLVQSFAAFVPTGLIPKPVRHPLAWKQFIKTAKKKDALLELHKNEILPVLNCSDIEECKVSGKIGALFTIEDAGVVGNDLSKLEQAYQYGVRIASMTWNHENTLAFPNSSDTGIMKMGLKPFGIQVVEEMNRLGIVVDVSHLSDGGFWDVVKYSEKPFIATHSNSREMTNHPRNLTDDMIKALAEQGGVMGLNFAPDFLSDRGDKQSRIEDMVKHVLHIREVAGSSVLAIGSDFDGISGDLEIGTPAQMPLLADALKKNGVTEAEIDAMWSRNILWVFKEVWR